jgi:phosphatidate cytidylyltransferase
MALVWVADISAYFVGRAFGRHKLAPAISPGKTWEGASGAILGGLLYVFLLRQYGNLPLTLSVAAIVPVTAVLVAISIIGDLFESMIKRQAGVKDSSQLLPGHGGVLDRIDSLTSTLPLVVAAFGLYTQYKI